MTSLHKCAEIIALFTFQGVGTFNEAVHIALQCIIIHQRFERVMAEGYRIVSVLELWNLLRSE